MDYIKGIEALLYIKQDGVNVPVACLTSNPINETSETIETTTRDNAGWRTSLPTLQSYSIPIEGVCIKDDADSGNNVFSYRRLRELKRNRTIFEWEIRTLNGYYIDYGKGYISTISQTDSVEGFQGFSAEIVGFGKPLETDTRIRVLSNVAKDTIYTQEENTPIKI